MLAEALPGQLLELGTRAAIVGVRMDGNASAWGEDASDLDVARIHQLDEVFHDDVDTVLMEVSMTAEREEIELERLRLDHLDIRDVRDDDVGEVGLPCDGAEAGELGAIELDPIVILGVLVDEGLEHLGCVILLVYCLLVAQEGQALFF